MKRHYILYCIIFLGYLLGTHKGYLALWQENASVPAQVYPCRIASLPREDQALLNTGIPISSCGELSERLEDYLS